MEKDVTHPGVKMINKNVLTDDKKLEILRLSNENMSWRGISRVTGISRNAIGSFLKRETHKEWWDENSKPIAAGTFYDHHKSIKIGTGKRYIITSAQNNTYVHRNFLKALEVMAERHNAEILVGTFSYNTSGFQNLSKDEGDWFDPLIVPYICSEPVQIAQDLIFCGELNILPTATNPLSGFHSYTKGASGIFPHAKVQLESLPNPKNMSCARMLYTTGAVTQRNYIQKKAGQKASFHHVFGALFVEIDQDGDWFARQLIAETDSGVFYDLDTKYTPNGYITGCQIEAINYGDIHSEKYDTEAALGSFIDRKKSMLAVLRPKFQFVHDVLDMSARNHHTIQDPYIRFKSFRRDVDTVEGDIKTVCDVLELMQYNGTQTIVVESNHDLALQRWLKTADYKTDPANALFFLELQYKQYCEMDRGNDRFSVFEYAVKTRNKDLRDVAFLRTDESFMICGDDGIECGSHGDLGANGAKGSAQSYTRFGRRYNIGHSHSARIIDGVYQAGTLSKMDLGYNRGPSSWSHSNIITHVNGKRQIVTLRGKKWRAEN